MVGWSASSSHRQNFFPSVQNKDWATGWTVRGRNPVGARFSAHTNRPWGPPSLLWNGCRIFPGGTCGRGVGLTLHPHLVCRGPRKSRAIPLFTLTAFVACKKGETYLQKNCSRLAHSALSPSWESSGDSFNAGLKQWPHKPHHYHSIYFLVLTHEQNKILHNNIQPSMEETHCTIWIRGNNSDHLVKNVKCTLVQALRLCTGRTAHRESRGIALLFLDHGSRRGWGVSVTPGRFLPPGKTRYPLYRRLGGPQGRSGHVRKISPPPGFDPRTVQPVASRYTDWAIPVTI